MPDPQILQQFKDKILCLENGDLLFKMMVEVYNLSYNQGYNDATKECLEDYKHILKLINGGN